MKPLAIGLVLLMGDMPPVDPPDADIQLPCHHGVCLVPQALMEELAAAHNGLVDENRILKKQLAANGCNPVPKLKKERDL